MEAARDKLGVAAAQAQALQEAAMAHLLVLLVSTTVATLFVEVEETAVAVVKERAAVALSCT